MNLHKHSTRSLRKPCRTCGKSDGLYWAHDTDSPQSYDCRDCQVNGKFTLVESVNGDPKQFKIHDCRARQDASVRDRVWTASESQASQPEVSEPEHDVTPTWSPEPVSDSPLDPEPEPYVAPAPAPAPSPAPSGDNRMEMLNALLDMLAPKVDAQQVRDILRSENGQLIRDLESKINDKLATVSLPTTVKVERPNGEVRTIEGAHKRLPVILKIIAQRLHVLMVGPAGTGKSTIADNAADALGLPYFSISLSPQTPASSILGYMQAAGEYVRSLYREAYEHGGVFHFDEFDNAHPSVLAVINASLANGQMAFPDGMVKRHPDFVCVASANTYGRGADRAYVGRQTIDAATLDRFVVVPVEVDEGLERAICESTGADSATVTEVLRFVRGLRHAADVHKMPLVFSPRASHGVCTLLTAGVSLADAIEFRVRKGISDSDWSKVSSNVDRIRL